MLLPGSLEGIGRYTWETSQRIVNNHPENEYYFLFDRPCDTKYVFSDNIRPIVLNPPARHPLLWSWWFEYSVKNALEKWKIDRFYSPDGFLSIKSEIPTLLVSHDLAFEHFPAHLPYLTGLYYRHFSRKFHERANHIIAVSEGTKKDIVKTYQIPESKITVAYNGPTPGFKPIGEQQKMVIRDLYADGHRYFICLGAIHPRKNLTRVISAYNSLCREVKEEILLLIVGRYAWKYKPVIKAIRQSPFRERIRVFNHTQNETAKMLAASEGLVYVSLWEGFGLPVLEALSCEVPVITSNESPMEEIAGEYALYIEPENEIEIKGAMQKIIQHPGLFGDLSNAASQVKSKFSWEETSEIIYRKLIGL